MKEKRCPDCNAYVGEYHLPHCDIERCPKCGLQLITCDCEFTEISNDGSSLFLKDGGSYKRYKVKGTIEDFQG